MTTYSNFVTARHCVTNWLSEYSTRGVTEPVFLAYIKDILEAARNKLNT